MSRNIIWKNITIIGIHIKLLMNKCYSTSYCHIYILLDIILPSNVVFLYQCIRCNTLYCWVKGPLTYGMSWDWPRRWGAHIKIYWLVNRDSWGLTWRRRNETATDRSIYFLLLFGVLLWNIPDVNIYSAQQNLYIRKKHLQTLHQSGILCLFICY